MSHSSVAPQRFLDIVLEIETANQNTYSIYAQVTDHYSARNLLLALQAASQDRLEKLNEFRRLRDPEACFDAARLAALPDPTTDAEQSFDAGMQYTDFLCLIARRESSLEERYGELVDASTNPETAAVFGSLAHTCKRQATLARARYDVETLK